MMTIMFLFRLFRFDVKMSPVSVMCVCSDLQTMMKINHDVQR